MNIHKTERKRDEIKSEEKEEEEDITQNSPFGMYSLTKTIRVQYTLTIFIVLNMACEIVAYGTVVCALLNDMRHALVCVCIMYMQRNATS